MDLAKVCPNGSYIRFFENAFEWENILYVFTPTSGAVMQNG